MRSRRIRSRPCRRWSERFVYAYASRGRAARDSIFRCVLHRAHERVDLLERRVDVRRDARALIVELLCGIRTAGHRLPDDAVLVPQEVVECARLNPVDADVRDAPRLPFLEARV